MLVPFSQGDAHGHLSWFVCVVRNPDSQRKQPGHLVIQTWMGRLFLSVQKWNA